MHSKLHLKINLLTDGCIQLICVYIPVILVPYALLMFSVRARKKRHIKRRKNERLEKEVKSLFASKLNFAGTQYLSAFF